MKPVLIFDLDGTLVDSLPGIAACLNRTLAAHGLPGHSDAMVRTFVGDGLRNLILRAVPHGADGTLIESLLTLYRKDYALSWRDGSHIYPGIQDMLQDLQTSGFEMAVLSNKVHDFTVDMVRRLFPAVPFALILGQREGIPHKPDPAGALEIARELEAAPAACVMIGDSTVDIETGRNAGMRSIAVGWGYHDRGRLIAAGPDQLAETPADLAAMVRTTG